MRSGFFSLSGAWVVLSLGHWALPKGQFLPPCHLQLAGKGCVEGKGAVLLVVCLARCAACAPSPYEKQGGWFDGQRPLVSSDALGFPTEECPARFNACFDLCDDGWWVWTLEASQLNKLGNEVAVDIYLCFCALPTVINSQMLFIGLRLQLLLPSGATLVRLRGHAAAFSK